MATETSGGRRHLAEPQETADSDDSGSRAGTEYRAEKQRTAVDDTEFTVVRQGMRVVWVPGETKKIKWGLLREVVSIEPVELVRAIVPMEDAQVNLSDLASIYHFLPATPPLHNPTLQHTLSCSRLRRFGGVDLGVYRHWLPTCRGRADMLNVEVYNYGVLPNQVTIRKM